MTDNPLKQEAERLQQENEQLRKDVMSLTTGISVCRSMLDDAKAVLTKYIEYKGEK